MEDIEIPPYFLCPISLQIMKDPVTTITGITYDRENIEQWLRTAQEATCPFTNQPLPRDSDLTPNHMLRRLIQAWCTSNSKYGIDRIPTPKMPLSKSYVHKLKRDLNVSELHKSAMKKLDELASEDRNRKCMMECGVAKVMVSLMIRCFEERNTDDLEEGLRVLLLVWSPSDENVEIVKDNYDLIQSLTWALKVKIDNQAKVKTYAVRILKMIIEVASSGLMEQLKIDFFSDMIDILHKFPSQQAIKSVLNILIQACQWGTNKLKIIEAGAVFEIIELELVNTDKKTSELNLCLLAHLCGCADGREQFLKHAGAIAMVAKRILRVSPGANDQAVHILALVSRFSGRYDVLMEMLRVGAVSKLCMVLQADCESFLKKKASEALRLHSNVWSNSPCIQVYLLTWHAR